MPTCVAGDVVCRKTDKQSATVRLEDEEDEDLTDVTMDETLMLNQEPSPEYDVDDEQRPRVSRVCQMLLATLGVVQVLQQRVPEWPHQLSAVYVW